MKKPIAACLVLLAMLIAACSSFAEPNPVPTSTFMPAPTLTPAPIRTTLLLMETPLAAVEWQGLPIMPGALAGEGDEEGYVFTIQATPQQVLDYYKLELAQLGWQASSQEEDSSLTLMFSNAETETLTVSVIAKGDEALVILAK